MAQGDQLPQHTRQQSRVIKLTNSREYGQTQQRTSIKQANKDEETVKYVKRILCDLPAQPAAPKGTPTSDVDSKLLPPLTSSNEVDLQVYAMIAVILNQFVQSWYNRLTPDHDFVAEIVQIIAHCTRGLEQRLRQVDLELLLLDELPELLVAHIDGIRIGSLNRQVVLR